MSNSPPKPLWQVPASAADPRVITALEALSCTSRRAFGGQRARSTRWLMDEYGGIVLDGSLAKDKGLAAELAGMKTDEGIYNPVEEPNAANSLAGQHLETPELVRLSAFGAMGISTPSKSEESSRLVAFQSPWAWHSGANAHYVWLVGRLFGGWDATTQQGSRQPIIFWKSGLPIAALAPMDLDRLRANQPPHAPQGWRVGGVEPKPTMSPEWSAELPPDAPAPQDNGVKAQAAWLDAEAAALTLALGGLQSDRGYRYMVPTRVGIAQFSVHEPLVRGDGGWGIHLRFDDPQWVWTLGFASAREVGPSGKWNHYFHEPVEVLMWLRRNLAKLQLRPELRPPPALLRMLECQGWRPRAPFRPAWVGGRWVIANVEAGMKFLRGGYPERERAAWRALSLNEARHLRSDA